jgi:hypothetical protein
VRGPRLVENDGTAEDFRSFSDRPSFASQAFLDAPVLADATTSCRIMNTLSKRGARPCFEWAPA